MAPLLSLIVAMGENNVMGNNGHLPWDIPEDMQHFRTETRGKPVIMGRKTYQSVGRPMPGRKNIVISRDFDPGNSGVAVAASLEDAIEIAKKEDSDEVFMIGGAALYQQSLPLADRLYLTIIDHAFEGDTFFPKEPDYQKLFPVQFRPTITSQSAEGWPLTFLFLAKSLQN